MQKKDETVLKSETKFLNQGLILNDMGIAVIFDMDGVLVNTIPFHKQAWKAFCKKYNFEYSEEELNRILPGKTTAHLLRLLFGKDLSEEEIKRLAQEKGEFYRGFSYKNLELIKGAVPFLEELTKNKIPIAIGTSGSPNNVSFIMNNTPLKNYFEVRPHKEWLFINKDNKPYVQSQSIIDYHLKPLLKGYRSLFPLCRPFSAFPFLHMKKVLN